MSEIYAIRACAYVYVFFTRSQRPKLATREHLHQNHSSMASVAHPICPPTFDSLPNEVISAVCSHLPFESCRQLVLVSRRLKAICEPHLYRDIQFKIRWSERQQDKVRLDGLFVNFEKRPQLCLYVKALTLATPEDYERRDELLRLLPEVRHLDLTSPISSPREYLTVRHMNSLETLTLDFTAGRTVYLNLIDIILEHLWMPRLKHLEVVGTVFAGNTQIVFSNTQDNLDSKYFGNALPDGQCTTVQPRTSPVTTLRLLDCWRILAPRTLPSLLRSIRVLNHFTLTFNCPWEEHESWISLSPTALGETLKMHTDTLVELIIASNDAAYFVFPSYLGTLANYRHLKRLAVPEPFLLSDESKTTIHDLLPSRLEDLQLQYPMTVFKRADQPRRIRYARMHSLASAKPHCLPNSSESSAGTNTKNASMSRKIMRRDMAVRML